MKYTIEDATLTAVADKLREKTGTDAAIAPEEMPDMVGEVFEAGEKSEWDKFWDVFQLNGNKASYPYGFYNWQAGAFNPKYDIKFSENNSANMTFAYGRFDTIRVQLLAIPKSGATVTLSNTFTQSDIKEISKLVLTSEVLFSNAFAACKKLETLNVDGTIGKNGFDVHDSVLLTHDSLMSIINTLEDKTGASGTWTVTFGEANLAKLSEEEIGIAKAKGWDLA